MPNARETEKTDTRHPGRRERDRRSDLDWTRNNRVAEQDPEWLIEPAQTEQSRGRTQEDFQLWKQQMRAAADREKGETAAEQRIEEKEEIARPTAVSPLGAEGGFDKLLGMWGESKKSEHAEPTKTQNTKPRPSRFAGFFAPHEDNGHIASDTTIPPPSASANHGVNEDKEGFQRILQMLGGATLAPQNQTQTPASLGSGLEALNDADNRRREELFSPSTASTSDTRHLAAPPQDTMSRVSLVAASDSSNLQSKNYPSSTGASFSSGQLQYSRDKRLDVQGSERPLPNLPSRQPFDVQSLLNRNISPNTAPLSRESEFLLNLMHQSQPDTLSTPAASFYSPEAAPNRFADRNMREISSQKATVPPPNIPNDPYYRDNNISQLEFYNGMATGATKSPHHRMPPGFLEGAPPADMQRQPRRAHAEQVPRPSATMPTHSHNPELFSFNPPGILPQQDKLAPPPGLTNGSGVMRLSPGFTTPHDMQVNNRQGLQRGPALQNGVYDGQNPMAGPPGLFVGPNGPQLFAPTQPPQMFPVDQRSLPPAQGQRRDIYHEIDPGRGHGRGFAPGRYGP